MLLKNILIISFKKMKIICLTSKSVREEYLIKIYYILIKTLIYWTLKQALRINFISKIIVSSDLRKKFFL